MKNRIDYLITLTGFSRRSVSHRERFITSLGGFCGILGVFVVSTSLFDGRDATLIVASMGASAVLLFAVPHSALAQPWNVLGGHLIAAIIGVSIARYIPDVMLASALSVGCAITAMHYLRCIHPPGGATALTAVVGGHAVQSMGYTFVLQPVLLNCIVILAIAIIFNALFDYYRYPSAAAKFDGKAGKQDAHYPPIEHADLVYALSQIDTIVPVSENDLLNIYELATGRSNKADD